MKTKVINSIIWIVLISIICICLDIMYEQSAQIHQLENKVANWETTYKLAE